MPAAAVWPGNCNINAIFLQRNRMPQAIRLPVLGHVGVHVLFNPRMARSRSKCQMRWLISRRPRTDKKTPADQLREPRFQVTGDLRFGQSFRQVTLEFRHAEELGQIAFEHFALHQKTEQNAQGHGMQPDCRRRVRVGRWAWRVSSGWILGRKAGDWGGDSGRFLGVFFGRAE